MLRPSRPMMRPFMSSDGSSTIETVVAAAWLAASRPMPVEMMLRTRRSDSCLRLLLDPADHLRHVVADVVLGLLQQQLAGLRLGHARRALELAASAASLVAFSSSCSVPRVHLAVADRPARGASAPRPSGRAARRGRSRAPRPWRPRSGAARAAPPSPGGRELQLLGLELGLLAEGIGVALRVFEQRLGLQGVGLGPHRRRTSSSQRGTPTEPPTRSAATTATARPRGGHETTSSPRRRRGMSDPARRPAAPGGNHATKAMCERKSAGLRPFAGT